MVRTDKYLKVPVQWELLFLTGAFVSDRRSCSLYHEEPIFYHSLNFNFAFPLLNYKH